MIRSKSTIEIESFAKMWASAFPDVLPLSHSLKHQCKDCWFRIHSLPESKRYAENAEEYEMILSRQNEVATDILGENTKAYIIAGEYDWEVNQAHVVQYDDALKIYDFCILNAIDLFKFDPNEYEENQTYTPAFGETAWVPHKHDELLLEVAKDRSRAFFVSFENNSIFAPYDGGADFLVRDRVARDYYKNKYKMYLSDREDGY